MGHEIRQIVEGAPNWAYLTVVGAAQEQENKSIFMRKYGARSE